MATIKDIANKLGVSVSTVSKGLNGASDISEELRHMVLDTAVEMGYSTKRSRKEEHRKLCILIKNMNYETIDGFGYDIVLGFKQIAFRHKWQIEIIPATAELQASEKYDTFMLKNAYCGAFMLGFTLEDEWMKQLPDTTMPTVLLDNYIPENPNVCYIGTDSFEGIQLVVRHLHNLGHRKIAFLNGELHSMVADHRQEAFENAMKRMNLAIDDELMVRDAFEEASGGRHAKAFLDKGATAIICSNDLTARGVVNACISNGYRVPEDVSVTGFDDISIATASTPKLTTVRQECNQLGRCAYTSLNALIHHIPVSRTELRAKLIVRESSGPAR